jgi:hypothetical protein
MMTQPDDLDVQAVSARLLREERDGWRVNATKLGSAATRLRQAARDAAAELNAALNDPDGHDLTAVATKVAARLDHAADAWLQPIIVVIDEGQELLGGVPGRGKTPATPAAEFFVVDGKNSPDWRGLLNGDGSLTSTDD